MKQFPEGIRVFQPFPDAPAWVIGQMLVTKSELVDWLNKQPKDQLRIDILKAKTGNYYCAVSDFEPKKKDIDSGNGRIGDGSIPWDKKVAIVTPASVSDNASDDLPF
jgi:hypothetical protein